MDLRELQSALEEFFFVGQAHKLNIFKELHERPDAADDLSKRMNFDKRSVYVLLEALVEMGYLEKDNEKYSVTDETYERLVNGKGNNYEGDFWHFLMYLTNPWQTLEHVLKTGKPDQSSYEDFSIKDFIKGMDSPWKKRVAPEIVEKILEKCPGAESVIDIGGAPGTIAREFALRGLNVLIYDLEECLEVMSEELSQIDNISVRQGDATESLPEGKFDIAFLGNICHGQSPEDNARIIQMCREILSDRGIIVIFENLRNESYLGARLALHMITQSPKGNIYSREEYIDWLKKAGFSEIKVEKVSDEAWQLVFGSVMK